MAERHASWEELVEMAIGGDGAVENDHMAECASCQRELSVARQIVTSLLAAGVGTPNAAVVDRAVRSIAARAQTESIGERVRAAVDALRDTLHAALVADSWTPSVAVRGATTAWPRVVVYETDDHSISLSMTPGEVERSTSIVGQVVPRDSDTLPEPRHATLYCDGREFVTPLSEFGEFTFSDARGATRLEITLGGQPITIDPLPDGHDAPEPT